MAYLTKKKSVFWKTFIIVLITAIIVLAVCLAFLFMKLRAFEKAQPDNLANEIFNSYFISPNPDKLSSLILPADSDEDAKKEMSSRIFSILSCGEPSYKRISAETEKDTVKYLVSSGNTPLMSFSFVKDPDEKTGIILDLLSLSYNDYTLSHFENEMPDFSIYHTVSAPTGYTVSVNGDYLRDENIAESNISFDGAPYAPEGLTKPTYTRYSIPADIQNPQISVLSPDGIAANITHDEKTDSYTAEYIYSYNLYSLYEQAAITAAKAYSMYLKNDLDFAYLEVYLDPESAFYEQTKSLQRDWVPEHEGFEFANVGTYQYISWTQDVLSCRVIFDYIQNTAGGEEYSERFDKILFFKINGERIALFDSYTMN